MKLAFLGHSAWGLEADGQRIMIDPYPVSETAARAMRDYAQEDCDAILVTHGAPDHLGIAFDLVIRAAGAVLVSEPAVIRHAQSMGVASERCRVLAWNGERVIGGWHIRAVEARHASIFTAADGQTITGMPLGFVAWHQAEPEVRVIHLGDTSLFSDLQLLGMLYRPMVALIGVGAAAGFFPEMTPREGAQAAFWLGAEIALPMHCEADPAAAEAFCAAVQQLPRAVETWAPALQEVAIVTRHTRVERSTRKPAPDTAG